jgi:hypothetical protein
MIDNSGTVKDRKIYELTDIYDEHTGLSPLSPDKKNNQQVIVVDGRGYEQAKLDTREIHELTEVVEDELPTRQLHDAVMKQAVDIIEKIVRETVPDLAERIIREEIEKIKGNKKDSL